MKEIYLAAYDADNHKNLEVAFDTFEDMAEESNAKDLESYNIDLDKATDKFLLQMTKLFGRHIDMMYFLSCVNWNNFGSSLSDNDQIEVARAAYNTWLKDESDMSLCSISDKILAHIENGDLTINEAVRKSGRQMLEIICWED